MHRVGHLYRQVGVYAAAARNHLLDDYDLRDVVRARIGPAAVSTGRPTLLLHGWIARKSSWLETIVNLHRSGVTHLHAASYNVFYDGLEEATDRFARRVRQVAHVDDEPVDVLAHSMGGIVALNAALNRDVARLLGHVVTLGSPYLGVPKARPARIVPVGPLRAAAQLAPGGRRLARLVDQAAEQLTVPWTCLWSARDELVPPESAQGLAGPTVTRHALEPAVGHLEMLMAPDVAATVAGRLQDGATVAA